jgi:hypothetical protein
MSYLRYLCLFVGWPMSYLRYLCLFVGWPMSFLLLSDINFDIVHCSYSMYSGPCFSGTCTFSGPTFTCICPSNMSGVLCDCKLNYISTSIAV